jgi:hypothetical protein
MPSANLKGSIESSAELAFREAFERLKANVPSRLAKHTRLSQNNVAKEAGYDPSALKKSRYPELVNEIQNWLREQPTVTRSSTRSKMVGQKKRNLELKDRILELLVQRDTLASLLVQADSKILELSRRVGMLEAMMPKNVIVLSSQTDNS